MHFYRGAARKRAVTPTVARVPPDCFSPKTRAVLNRIPVTEVTPPRPA